MNKIFISILILTGITSAQKLDDVDLALYQLEKLVIHSSRSAQKVLVEDFTGLQ